MLTNTHSNRMTYVLNIVIIKLLFILTLADASDESYYDCNGKECTNGAICESSTGKCMCRDGYWGEHCKKCECNGKSCDRDSGQCECTPGESCTKQCATGFWGENCTVKCDCYNGASCNHITGICDCPPGFMGLRCQYTCKAGTFGKYCSEECSCGDNGTCLNTNGICICAQNWTGKRCTERICPEGYYIIKVNSKQCQLCQCETNMICDPNEGCICSKENTGYDCDQHSNISISESIDTVDKVGFYSRIKNNFNSILVVLIGGVVFAIYYRKLKNRNEMISAITTNETSDGVLISDAIPNATRSEDRNYDPRRCDINKLTYEQDSGYYEIPRVINQATINPGTHIYEEIEEGTQDIQYDQLNHNKPNNSHNIQYNQVRNTCEGTGERTYRPNSTTAV